MDTKKNKESVPVKPYDDSMWDRYAMYDKIPYVWNSDLTIDKTFQVYSGNIIKYYQYQMQESIEVKHE
jgi:hypothetical protein